VALIIHMLLGVLPWSQERVILPQPTGNKTITIDLTPANAVVKKITPKLTKQNERNQTPSLQQEQVKKSSPTAMSLPKTNSPKNPVAKPVRHIRKTTVAKVVPSREKKATQQRQQAPHPPSRSPIASTTLPATPGKSQITNQIAPGTSPALIKAKPLYDQNPKPPYPNLARQRGWQGVVILAVTVLEDGSPNQLTIQTSSGHDLLDKTALKTVKQWHFLPGTKNNIPTPMEVLVPVHFLLH
jgi:periplasmic protein TonB